MNGLKPCIRSLCNCEVNMSDMHLALRSLPSVVCTSLLSALVTDSHQQLRQLQSRSYLAKNQIAQLSC